jgi:hypothetical protein
MNLNEISKGKIDYNEHLKTYKKIQLEFLEGIDNISNNYQSVEFDDETEPKKTESSENNLYDLCLSPPEPNKKSNDVIENFLISDNKLAKTTIKDLVSVANNANIIAGKMKNSMDGIVGTAIENLKKPEIKVNIKNIVDDYSEIIIDSISRTLADPSRQHKVDKYIVKPFWDLYIIPFIDMYVVFLIMYYVIFMLTMVWIRKNT